MATYQIHNLTFRYPGSAHKALDNISLTVGRGEFLTICGPSGSGKSTLLRHLKPALTPHGEVSGWVLFEGVPLQQVDRPTQTARIGFVMQQPDNQLVTDKVWHELAFGLENLGLNRDTIRLRVAEMASFFGIQGWFMQDTATLSGGQKQLLNLASVMALQPSVLILDEPTAHLDPMAAASFLETVRKINRELGTTVLLAEHRLEEVLPISDRVAVMDKGQLLALDAPARVGQWLKTSNHSLFIAMPTPVQVYAGIGKTHLPCPLTVREGRQFLDGLKLQPVPPAEPVPPKQGETLLLAKQVWFRYDKKGDHVLKGLNLEVKKGTIHAIVGGNGAGKTTLLHLLCNACKPYRGTVRLEGKHLANISDKALFDGLIGLLPQHPQTLFVHQTVEQDLLDMVADCPVAEQQVQVRQMAEMLGITHLLPYHPHDISGGEQQKVALAMVLLRRPRLLLLDEPTKGLDAWYKMQLRDLLRALTSQGVTVLLVSHDIEFCAKTADYCSLLFDGSVVATGTPAQFFSGNGFYTTAANRMARHLFPTAITAEEVVALCRQQLQP